MNDKIVEIKTQCLKETSQNPIEIVKRLMNIQEISMHGPEHHMIDGAALLTAVHNAGEHFNLDEALDELAGRAAKMPGATCGQWGICGSASSVGAALAIIHETGPLSNNEYYKDNMRLTSRILACIGEVGGPRCCKRNAFIALTTAVNFLRERYGMILEYRDVQCDYNKMNMQCIQTQCPFYGKN